MKAQSHHGLMRFQVHRSHYAKTTNLKIILVKMQVQLKFIGRIPILCPKPVEFMYIWSIKFLGNGTTMRFRFMQTISRCSLKN